MTAKEKRTMGAIMVGADVGSPPIAAAGHKRARVVASGSQDDGDDDFVVPSEHS